MKNRRKRGSSDVRNTLDEFSDLDTSRVSLVPFSRKQVSGFHLRPRGHTRPGIVVTLGGSEGSSAPGHAMDLASAGYEVLAVYYFGQEDQPARLSQVPLEFFAEARNYAREKAKSTRPLSIVGVSKGAELALVLTHYYDSIDNLVLIAPTTHVYQGLGISKEASSWSYQGRDVPFVSFRGASIKAIYQMFVEMALRKPVSYRYLYESSKDRADNVELGRLRLEEFAGNILLMAGTRDLVWPSNRAVFEMMKTERTVGQVYGIVFPGVGHVFGGATVAGRMALGGSLHRNTEAALHAKIRMQYHLASWHGNTTECCVNVG